ncbi:hypothetical protein [Spirillospora sp. CA-294931]|uniref:hypothetical protein n=1 Tax=Spirillospora sp. CA-294931 TaxID=3240042 RepID=UPI003D89FA98
MNETRASETRRRMRLALRAVVVLAGVAALGAALLPAVWPSAGNREARPGAHSGGITSSLDAPTAAGPTRAPVRHVTHAELSRALKASRPKGYKVIKASRFLLGFLETPGAASCHRQGARIPGSVIEVAGSRYHRGAGARDGYVIQGVAYPSAGHARRAAIRLRDLARQCPRFKRFREIIPLTGRRRGVAAHTNTWRVLGEASDAQSMSVRVREEIRYTRSRWPLNSTDRLIDYSQRGNLLVVQLIHTFRKDSGTPRAATAFAAASLDRLLTRIGAGPCRWTSGYTQCGTRA